MIAIPIDVTVSRPQYGGTIGGLGDMFLSASWATGVKQVVVQPAAAPQYNSAGDQNADTVVRVFDDTVLTPLAALRLPMMPAGAGKSVFARGKFVFTTPNADKIFVIVQADAPSLAFALVTLTP